MSTARVERLLLQALACLEAGLLPTAAFQAAARSELRAHELQIVDRAVEEAQPISQMLLTLGWLDRADIALLRAGEEGGTLDEALRSLVSSLAEGRQARTALIVTLAYPSLLLIIASLLLPAPVLVVNGLGAYMAAAAPLFLSVVATWFVVLVVWPRLGHEHFARRVVLSVARRVPGVGGILRRSAQARFLQVLARAFQAGQGIRAGLDLALDAAGETTSDAMRRRLVRDAERGGLAAALGTAQALAPWQLAIIANAEQTGTLVVALDRMARELNDEVKRRTRVVVIAATGAVFAAVAFFVAWQVVSGFSNVLSEIDAAIEQQTR